MSISYTEPLSRAVERATNICFRPFDLGKWFVLGFACWLARLTEGGSGGLNVPVPPIGERSAEGAVVPGPVAAIGDPEMFGVALVGLVIGCAVLFFLVLLPLLLWIGSRGQFMFLDNVVHDRALIQEPWKEFKVEGNSLFLWRLGFIFVALAVVALALTPAGLFIWRYGSDQPPVMTMLLLLAPLLLVAFGLAYIDFFLRAFVVPIMYRERIKATAAWRRFGPTLKRHLGSFLLFGLWVVILAMAVVFGVLVLVVVTCCIAGIVLIIPYLGTVALLPVYVALRALSVEFLAQFSDEFRIFPELAPAMAGGAPPPAAPPPGPPPALGPDAG